MENRNIHISEKCPLGFSDRVRARFLFPGACDIVSVSVLLIQCRIMILVMLEIIGRYGFKLFHALNLQTLVLLCARGNKSFQEFASNMRQSCTEVSAQTYNDRSLYRTQWRAIEVVPMERGANFSADIVGTEL